MRVYEPGDVTISSFSVILAAMDARRGGRPAVAVVAITVLIGATVVSVVAAPKRRVILYGDSLASEARDWFSLAMQGDGRGEVVDRTLGGTAICDWLDKMRGDAHRFQPSAVVFEFVGNNVTNCVRGPTGPLTGAALVDRYREDARTATKIFAGLGVRVYWMGAPAVAPASPTTAVDINAVRRVEEAEAGGWTFARPPLDRVQYVDAGQAVLDHGRYAGTLPCLPSERLEDGCAGGRMQVRADDGVHFCPAGAVQGGGRCPVYSGGAARFGLAMAAPVRRDLGL